MLTEMNRETFFMYVVAQYFDALDRCSVVGFLNLNQRF